MSRPEDRYVRLEKKTLPDGRVVYKSARPRPVVVSDTDTVVDATITDRCDVIAANVYGSAMDWWRVAAANGRINGSLFLKPGTKVIIPEG